jgi:hypothetical protein
MMNADPKYRRLQFTIADLLAVMVIVAILGATSRLPTTVGKPSVPHAVAMLAVVYAVKLRILSLRVRSWLAVLLYLAVLLPLLPYLYRFVFEYRYIRVSFLESRDREFLYRLMYLTWLPPAFFTIPTVFFLYDVLTHRRPSWKSYVKRSLFEIVVLVPSWLVVSGLLWSWLRDSLT